jgi:hypothetical protein
MGLIREMNSCKQMLISMKAFSFIGSRQVIGFRLLVSLGPE